MIFRIHERPLPIRILVFLFSLILAFLLFALMWRFNFLWIRDIAAVTKSTITNEVNDLKARVEKLPTTVPSEDRVQKISEEKSVDAVRVFTTGRHEPAIASFNARLEELKSELRSKPSGLSEEAVRVIVGNANRDTATKSDLEALSKRLTKYENDRANTIRREQTKERTREWLTIRPSGKDNVFIYSLQQKKLLFTTSGEIQFLPLSQESLVYCSYERSEDGSFRIEATAGFPGLKLDSGGRLVEIPPISGNPETTGMMGMIRIIDRDAGGRIINTIERGPDVFLVSSKELQVEMIAKEEKFESRRTETKNLTTTNTTPVVNRDGYRVYHMYPPEFYERPMELYRR